MKALKGTFGFLFFVCLTGCSVFQPVASDKLASCTVPIRRNAGMGVTIEDCAVWVFK